MSLKIHYDQKAHFAIIDPPSLHALRSRDGRRTEDSLTKFQIIRRERTIVRVYLSRIWYDSLNPKVSDSCVRQAFDMVINFQSCNVFWEIKEYDFTVCQKWHNVVYFRLFGGNT